LADDSGTGSTVCRRIANDPRDILHLGKNYLASRLVRLEWSGGKQANKGL
jgi:hypothetical protein